MVLPSGVSAAAPNDPAATGRAGPLVVPTGVTRRPELSTHAPGRLPGAGADAAGEAGPGLACTGRHDDDCHANRGHCPDRGPGQPAVTPQLPKWIRTGSRGRPGRYRPARNRAEGTSTAVPYC